MAKTLPQTRIPVSDPRRGFDAIGPEFGATIERVIGSGRYVHGPEHAAFEEELAAFLGVSHCAGVASGTDALELALAAVGCRRRRGGHRGERRRATRPPPPAGWAARCATPTSIPTTLGLTAATVEPALTAPTSRPSSPRTLRTDVRRRGRSSSSAAAAAIAVVEDCAQAAGRGAARRRAGSLRRRGSVQLLPDEESRRARRRRRRGHGRCRRSTSASARCASTAGRRSTRVDLRGAGTRRLDELQAAVLRVGLAASRRRGTHAGGRSSAATRRRCRRTPAASSGATARTSSGHLAVIVAEDRERLARSAGRRRGRYRHPLSRPRLRPAARGEPTSAFR